MGRVLLGLALCTAISACGGPLSLLTGGGPNVAANVQAGKTNTQTIGQTNVTEQKLVRPRARTIEQSTGETGVRTERVETIIVQREVPPWIWITWAMLLMLDSPLRWPAQIWGAFRRS
jgi:hypothetical protein